jgi:hypothetical protein
MWGNDYQPANMDMIGGYGPNIVQELIFPFLIEYIAFYFGLNKQSSYPQCWIHENPSFDFILFPCSSLHLESEEKIIGS